MGLCLPVRGLFHASFLPLYAHLLGVSGQESLYEALPGPCSPLGFSVAFQNG